MAAKTSDANTKLSAYLPWILLVGGIIALIASTVLSIEVFNKLKNPAYVPACNLSPIFSCTSVADSPQSRVFGFPNYFLGIASYSALAAIGAALLGGARFKRWFWLSLQAGMTLAIAFVFWLQYQSLYRIGALCPFCMVVWTVTIPMFWYTTLHSLREGYLSTPQRLKSAAAFIQKHHIDILVIWFLVIIALILKRFWYYWSTLI